MLKRWAAWPSGIRWLVGTAAVVLAAAIVWALFVPVPTWLARYDVGSATPALVQTARDAARGRLLTLGAGLLAAGALFFTARNFILSREGQVTDRYTKAVEQLGSDKLDVRIGGIYALERVARDSAKDHPTVIEVLTAFIREHSREPLPPPDTSGPDQQRWIRPDVQAAVVVVGRRDARRDFLDYIDLTRANLGGANLNGLNFNRMYLTSGDLTGATLFSARLRGANLGGANLTRADFTNAVLTGATLTGANLTRAVLAGADLTGADFTGADLTGATLASAVLADADLTGADLASADLTGARWPEGVPVLEGWITDGESGRLKRAGELRAGGLSEVTAHYL